ncbi:MAG: A24 family peptidase [Brachymonas sp.]|nr:A24 family peptidase [Brachymonas sp.]
MPETTLYIALAALLGLLVGSFLNVVIYRLPRMMERGWAAEHAAYAAQQAGQEPPLACSDQRFNLLTPPSRCRQCGNRVRWYENIPVISFLALRGKCSSCKTPIGIRYPLVELVTALVAGWCVHRYGWEWQALAWFFFGAMLLCLTLIDWDTTYLPDSLTLPLLWAGLLLATVNATGIRLDSAVWGAAIGYLSLWSIYWGFKLLTGKEGMGFGDFKLFAALGAWFGVAALIPIILMAAVIGSIIGIAMKFGGQLREGGYVPFGPFLALGGAAVWLGGADNLMRMIGLH